MESERRWVTPVGLAVIGLVVAANAGGSIGLGTSGAALVVTVGVAVYAAAAILFLLWFDAPRPVTVALLLIMAASATVTHHADPRGTGGIGLYLGMAFAPLRLPLGTAATVSAVGVLVFDLHLALVAPNEGVFILVVTGGAAFFFVLGMLLRREQDQHRHIAGLLVQLEASREAERASAALAERSRLAREMHDVLAHTLSGLVLQLDAARLLARSQAPQVTTAQDGAVRDRGAQERSATLTATIDRAYALARDGLAEARQAITALRGDRLPGPELLADLVDEHRRVSAGTCRLTVTGQPTPLPPDARLAVYRTAQEALSNVRKHAPGADVDVQLCWAPDQAVLLVEDRHGNPPTAPDRSGSGYGLTGMAERAQLLGGDLSAGPTRAGFRVALRVPVRRAP